ncbi:MAG: aminopeptidase [Gammaproteobacteria bacterium]|nr:aminopeptidase [Gammaproteobacteria bacterium]NIR98613.1 aminopeptidase [Gammaproteobacteria bacterium]NIT64336.1 aminopeptidase [Gammaproteobacteria bacterium]NIV21260.1 aminopeptidase [Gammaproteobacteria bacterium]NIX10964.1 aminopeptidase [Gammaproteobacteria bacterium]
MLVLRGSILALLAAALAGCSTLGYYAQSVGGQMDLLAQRRPIGEYLTDPDTEPALRERLRRVLRIRVFASRELGLPDNDSYRSYADLGRPFVVWNVFAAPELSLEPVRWCFPVAGCVSYRGYFAEEDARGFAAKLRGRGYDVHVAGAPAYSTLGWFDDPVPSTVIHWPEPRLAGMIFHELAHQQVYVKGATAFNESYAVVVEQEGIRRWLERNGDESSYREYRRERRRQQQFVDLVMRARARLVRVYNSSLSEPDMRAAKRRALARMRAGYDELRRGWGGYGGFDRWMDGGLNNAKLASVAAYHRHAPALRALLRDHEGDLAAFHRAVRRLAALDEDARAVRLQTLANGVAAGG